MKSKTSPLLLSSDFSKFMHRHTLKPIIGISMGDPSGVGSEVILKAVKSSAISRLCKIVIIGDSFVFSKIRAFKPARRKCELIDLKNVPCRNFSFGKITPAYGKASIEYLDCALGLISNGSIDCLVTGPISKEAINLAGYKYGGHTEYFKAKTSAKKIAMMFAVEKLKVTLVTRHLSLKDAIHKLSCDNIFDAISLTYLSLRKQFGIKNPKVAVCALNPHAGESGLLGDEEIKIIKPAIKKARKKYRNIFGPYPCDTIFYEAMQNKYDAVIAMYHDQGLIPLKTLFFKKSVNVTLGLSFVRTSPCHGTAFDIAGKNMADPTSMVEAIKLAVHLAKVSRR